MVDEVTPAAQTAPVEATPVAPVAAPSVETPVTTPSEPAPVEPTPVTEPAPVAEPAPAETPAPEAKKSETLLGAEKKAEEKPAEVKPEEKPVEVKPEEKPAEAEKAPELPKYEFKTPENFQVDEAKMGEFTKALGEFESTTKVPHEEIQKLGQQFLEKHVVEMERYTKSLTDAWEKQANDWKESFLKDPEFQNRTNTVLSAAIDVIDTYAGTKEQAKEFRDLMESTKIGNHPAMIRLLSNIKLAKPEPKPLAAPQIPMTAKQSKISKMYGNKTGSK